MLSPMRVWSIHTEAKLARPPYMGSTIQFALLAHSSILMDHKPKVSPEVVVISSMILHLVAMAMESNYS